MPVRKISVSLSESALHAINEAAEREGLTRSAWIERKAAEERRRRALGETLRLFREETRYKPSKTELDRLRAELAELLGA